MIITGKKIRKVDKYLFNLSENENFYIAIGNANQYFDILSNYGLDYTEAKNISFLPRPLKASTYFNINGKYNINKNIPKEERTFEKEFNIIDWHGGRHSGTCFLSKPCWQKEFTQPPLIPLTYTDNLIISPCMSYNKENNIQIKHIINMFLEIFGHCEILDRNFLLKKMPIVKRLSWNILPPGKYPWSITSNLISKILITVPKNQVKIISKRHEFITTFEPDFMAIGEDGFFGYVVYGFIDKDIFVLESNKVDNATYIFYGEWEEATKLTKSEVLSNNSLDSRLIHNKNWYSNLSNLIMSNYNKYNASIL